uniref:Uncharacterized protein n=1 Tax=Rhizophora mucronata TaxID=61149 RepID=A0A2P2II23_RHIMU
MRETTYALDKKKGLERNSMFVFQRLHYSDR